MPGEIPLKDRIKQVIAAVIIVLTAIFTAYYWNDIFALLKDQKRLESWLNSFGLIGFLIFILIQIIQVVVFFIPGEAVQIAGGYLYGTVLGSLLSIVGIVIGSMICFILAKILGKPLVEWILGKERMEKLRKLVKNKKSMAALFFLFLLPGVPKDALTYVAGLTPIRFATFLIINLTARTPAIVVSSFFGSNLRQKDYSDLAAASVVIVLIFVICIVKRKEITKFISRKTKNK